jgi:dienelactone hydrolase
LDLEITDEEECEGYRRQRVVFDSEEIMSVPAYLLVPDGRRSPGSAVLAVHGHGPGKSRICGLEPGDPPGGDYAAELARHGHVVLAPDLRCFGERADWNPPDHYGCDTNLVHQVMGGWSPLTQNLWDLAQALDVLEEHPLVDPARVGMVGFSYGATVTLFLAAIDPRVAVAVVSGYFSSWAESHKVPWNMCGSQVLTGMLGHMEHVDLGALVAPRPLLIQTGDEDPLFPQATAEAGVARLRPLYEQVGAGDRLVHDIFPGEHQWNGPGAYPFVDRWLGSDLAAG